MDPQAPSPSSLAAHCQLHAGQPFTAVCPRCGTYMCNVCTEGGRFPSCPACRERTGVGAFPFTRDNYTIGGLFQHATDSYKKNWAVLALATLIILIPIFMIAGVVGVLAVTMRENQALLMAIQLGTYVPQLIVQGFLQLALINITVKAVNGHKPELGDAFSVWNKLGKWFAQSLISAVVILPGLVLVSAAVFGIYKATSSVATAMLAALVLAGLAIYLFVGLAFASFEIVAQPRMGALAGLRNAWQLASGKRLEIMLVGFVCFALYMAGALACGIGALFTMGLATCLFSTYYLALRNGAQDLVD